MQESNYDEVDGIDDDSIYEELGLDDLMDSSEQAAREEAAEAAKAASKTPDKKSKKEKEEEVRIARPSER